MKKNNKGFTLIELLAVIVVLAIIMVIATQQVNGTIKKSRGNSFYETAQSIRKSMQTVCAQDNKVSTTSLNAAIEASDVTVSVTNDAGDSGLTTDYGYVTVTATGGGKFTNRTDPSTSANFKLVGDTYYFATECPIETTSTGSTD